MVTQGAAATMSSANWLNHRPMVIEQSQSLEVCGGAEGERRSNTSVKSRVVSSPHCRSHAREPGLFAARNPLLRATAAADGYRCLPPQAAAARQWRADSMTGITRNAWTSKRILPRWFKSPMHHLLHVMPPMCMVAGVFALTPCTGFQRTTDPFR